MFIFKTQSQPGFRLFFFIPWVNKSSIACLKSRDYSSSVPIRYIPKKSSKINKLENSQPPKSSKKKQDCNFSDASALRNDTRHGGIGIGIGSGSGSGEHRDFNFDKKPQCKRMPATDLLFSGAEQDLVGQIDCDLGVVGYKLIEEPEQVVEELRIHQKKCREHDILQFDKSKHGAEKLAIELLATRAFTAVELKKKLHGKKFSQDTAEAVINDFQSRGLINDSLYAEAFCRSRWSSSTWGPRRIKQALLQKGVRDDEVEKAIKLVFKDEESGGDNGSSHGLSKLSMDHLYVQASKQWLRSQDVPKETRKSRIIRWLQYRGFHWGVISFILKKLESEYPPKRTF